MKNWIAVVVLGCLISEDASGQVACQPAPTPEDPLVLAEFQAWHGLPSHSHPAFSCAFWLPNARAYDSGDANFIMNQIQAAKARGVDGFVINWYGPAAPSLDNHQDRLFMDDVTSLWFEKAEEAGDFCLSLLYDEGTLRLSGVDLNQYQGQAEADLSYADATYLSSPAYLKLGGKPALFVFPYPDVDPILDWSLLRQAMSLHDVTLIDQDPNPGDLDHDSKFDGFFAWVQPDAGGWDPSGQEWGRHYLEWFYGTMKSVSYSAKMTIGGVWPGFDDSLASWGLGRFMSRDGGTVYDETWALATANQAKVVMIATWNDFEEGTDIEYGVQMQVDMENPEPEILVRSSPLEVTWTKVGDDVLQVYENGELIFEEHRSPPAQITLPSNQCYEIKVWTNASSPLSKAVSIRRQDPDPAFIFSDGFESGDTCRWSVGCAPP